MNQYDEQLTEALSALMDGEATDLETRRLLKVLSSVDDPQAQLLRRLRQILRAWNDPVRTPQCKLCLGN